ncbi:MAG: hypothetical protein H0Z35_13045 [Thermoanaerobacteraceae bacterium]|nr:hypothetical protein [Thermoanaerobacteraceae bacterium]
MKFSRIAVFIIVLTLLVSSTAYSAPTDLKAIPVSGFQVDLYWKGLPGETYKVWLSTDGEVWQNIYIGVTTAYSVSQGIEPYVNYYFVVTDASVANYPEDATVTNATYEAVAFPPNQHAHAYYSKNTDMCSACHLTHTAVGNKLLREATINDTCMTCHDGTGSKYNVVEGLVSMDGTFAPENNPLKSAAGPFGAILDITSSTANPTSIHTIGNVVYEAPGGNPMGTGEEWNEPLGCSSCHDAHDSPNYRMITTATPDNRKVRVKGYAVTDQVYGREHTNYVLGMSEFCMGCHKDFYATKGAGHIPATDTYNANGTYRHPVEVAPADYEKGPLDTSLPLEGEFNDNRDKVMCLTCHFAHGSVAETNDVGDKNNDGGTPATNYLLRMDYRGVCQDCHKK